MEHDQLAVTRPHRLFSKERRHPLLVRAIGIHHIDVEVRPDVPTLALVVVAFKARIYALKAQDRVIRLEERLRLAALLPEPLRGRIPQLTASQLIALRFACDAEVPGLVEKTLAGNLPRAEIKKAIVTWRPDYFRV